MACAPWKWTPDRRDEVEAAIRASRTRAEAAGRLGVTIHMLDQAIATYKFRLARLFGTPAPAGVAVSAPAISPPARSTSEPVPQDVEPPSMWIAPPVPTIPVGREMTVSLLGDLHAPELDRPAWDACLRWHADVKPDLIVVTELGEWLSMTRHGGNWGAMFEDDVKATRRPFVQLRSVCPDARVVCLEANHDTRVGRRLREFLPQLRGHLVVPHELHLDDLGVEWVPETVPFRVGRLKVIHGHQLASNAKGQVPENSGKRAIQRFGEPGWTVVYFHTHRRGYWEERHDTGTLRAVNLPCLRTLWPDWTQPAPTGWSHGFGVAHIGPAGQTNLYTVDIEHGSFVYGGKRYAAAA